MHFTKQMSTKFKKRYENVLLSYCNRLRSKKAPKTPGGLLYLGKWGPLRYAGKHFFALLTIQVFRNKMISDTKVPLFRIPDANV